MTELLPLNRKLLMTSQHGGRSRDTAVALIYSSHSRRTDHIGGLNTH